ncbi:MAG TPA: hypothetical protein VKO86_07615 [Gemmatimonadales bacterium]|nr:hypothetical protein [Gemmatimonadales bacterium]
MNNRWIYGLELAVFGWIAARGGWLAVRSLTPLGRIAGALALAFAAATALLLGAFVMNRPIRPLLHLTPFFGVGLVFLYETIRAARTVPGWTAPFAGLYSTLAMVLARRRPTTLSPASDSAASEADEEDAEE